ncbi:hypothetical protein [Shinella sp. GWS1]|nr:hypothetical protein [Shinella sp. GWS1]
MNMHVNIIEAFLEALVKELDVPYAASPPHGFFGCSDLTAISAVK